MKVLISGASGLIGSVVVANLEERGHEVVRLVRSPQARASEPISALGEGTSDRSAYKVVPWNPNETTVDTEALERLGPYEAVVHLAGEPIAAKRWSPAQKAAIAQSRIGPTKALSVALAGLGSRPAVMVSASAIGFYGDRGDEKLDESSGPGTGFLAQLCQDWEQATQPASQAGIRVVNVRTGIVLTSHGGALGQLLPLFKLGLGGKLGRGRQWMSWISLHDEVGGILQAIEDDSLSGPVNLTGPKPVTNLELTHTLGYLLHRPVFFAVPRLPLRVVLGREMAKEVVLASQRVIPKKLIDIGYSFHHSDVEAALRSALGMAGPA